MRCGDKKEIVNMCFVCAENKNHHKIFFFLYQISVLYSSGDGGSGFSRSQRGFPHWLFGSKSQDDLIFMSQMRTVANEVAFFTGAGDLYGIVLFFEGNQGGGGREEKPDSWPPRRKFVESNRKITGAVAEKKFHWGISTHCQLILNTGPPSREHCEHV